MAFADKIDLKQCGCDLCKRILKVIKDREPYLTEDEKYQKQLEKYQEALKSVRGYMW